MEGFMPDCAKAALRWVTVLDRMTNNLKHQATSLLWPTSIHVERLSDAMITFHVRKALARREKLTTS
jgi:hypothetical protein